MDEQVNIPALLDLTTATDAFLSYERSMAIAFRKMERKWKHGLNSGWRSA